MQSALILGGGTFILSKVIWEASTNKALLWAGIVAGVAYFASQAPSSVLHTQAVDNSAVNNNDLFTATNNDNFISPS